VTESLGQRVAAKSKDFAEGMRRSPEETAAGADVSSEAADAAEQATDNVEQAAEQAADTVAQAGETVEQAAADSQPQTDPDAWR
jgi:F0F1-type ATP synthase membrane subunit b/b'